MMNPTNAPEGANTPALSAAPVPLSGAHVAATDAFRAGYDQLDKSYVGRPYDARYGERYRELLLQLDNALAAAGPVTSATDAAALVHLESAFFVEEREGSELTGLSATRAGMMKGVAGFLATGRVETGNVSSTSEASKGAIPKAITAIPTDPDTIGPNAVAVAAFWEGYMGMDGVVMDWMEDGDDNRLETRFAALAEEFRTAVTTAGPPVSVMDALTLASLQHELLSDAVGLEPPVVFGARGVMLKAIADQLVQLVPLG